MKTLIALFLAKLCLLLLLICLLGIRLSAQDVIEAIVSETPTPRNEVLNVLATRNLSVTVFRNGDSITHAQSAEQWKQCSENKTPCWCYYQHEYTDSITTEILYNYFAVTDKRGLVPKGYRIPSIADFQKLADQSYYSDTWKRMWGSAIYDSVYCLRFEEFKNYQAGSRNSIGIKPGASFNFTSFKITRHFSAYYYWTVSPADEWTAYAAVLEDEDDACFAFMQRLKGAGLVVRCIKE